jgi:hypothetical protein
LYDRSQQDPRKRPSIVEAGLGHLPEWTNERLLAAAQALEREGSIINPRGPLLNVDLTSDARKRIGVRGAPPPAQAAHIGTNNNSPIQQIGPGAVGTQTATYNISRNELQKVVDLFRDYGVELKLEPKVQKQVDAQVATIEALLSQDEPNSTIIREAGKTLRTIVEGALGHIAATALTNPGAWTWLTHLPFG